jgi:hypothetical protein
MIEAQSDDAANITKILAQANAVPLPPVNIAEPSNPFNAADPSNIDLQELPKLRYDHQTKQAASGVRTSKKPSPTGTLKQPSLRQQLHQSTVDLIKKRGEVGVGSGADRFLRWCSSGSTASGMTDAVPVVLPPTGNAANAAMNAQAVAKRVRCRRLCIHLPTIISCPSSESQTA